MTCPVVFVCASPQNGDAHWRVNRPAARLAEAGIDAAVCWLGPDLMPTVPVAGRVVVVQRVLISDGDEAATRTWIAQLHAAGALAVVSDLDDDEISGSSIEHIAASQPIGVVSRTALERQARGYIAMLRAVDGVTVSTEPLAAVVRRFTDKPVHVVPNAIDVGWFRARLAPQKIDPEHLTIGWAGWWRPEADLAPMAEAWARIARRYPAVRFVVGGYQPDVIYRQPIDLDRIIRLPVAPIDRYPELYQVDIGCCAVADSPFSRSKSPIKAWEYALAGAATIGTPPLYAGEVSQYVNTAAEWEDVLGAWIESPDWRKQTNIWMQEYVERDHSLVGQLHRWMDAYREIVASVGVPA